MASNLQLQPLLEEIQYRAPDIISLKTKHAGWSRQPSATMSCQLLEGSQRFPSQPQNTKTIQIKYNFEIGGPYMQKRYHPCPGQPYQPGDERIAYLPHTPQGRALLFRLRHAFSRGYTFAIGTSLTSGRNNMVIWSGLIPHKTCLYSGGEFGYDPYNIQESVEQYFQEAHRWLDVLDIPKVETANSVPVVSVNTAVVDLTSSSSDLPPTTAPVSVPPLPSAPTASQQQLHQRQHSTSSTLSTATTNSAPLSPPPLNPLLVPASPAAPVVTTMEEDTANQQDEGNQQVISAIAVPQATPVLNDPFPISAVRADPVVLPGMPVDVNLARTTSNGRRVVNVVIEL